MPSNTPALYFKFVSQGKAGKAGLPWDLLCQRGPSVLRWNVDERVDPSLHFLDQRRYCRERGRGGERERERERERE